MHVDLGVYGVALAVVVAVDENTLAREEVAREVEVILFVATGDTDVMFLREGGLAEVLVDPVGVAHTGQIAEVPERPVGAVGVGHKLRDSRVGNGLLHLIDLVGWDQLAAAGSYTGLIEHVGHVHDGAMSG